MFWILVLVIVTMTSYSILEKKPIADFTFGSKTSSEYWLMFAEITKERKYFEEAGSYYRIPVFTPELHDLSGEEVILQGYYLPYSKIDTMIIISRYPNASCFFCGRAGIESVAMVEVERNGPRYRTDQRLAVKGKLKLNSTDLEQLAFIVTDAMVEELD